MSFLDTLRKNLTPEMFSQVTDMLGDDFDYDLVPRSRLNKVINQRNDLRKQLAGAPQPPAADTAVESDTEDAMPDTPTVDVKALELQWQRKQEEAVRDVTIKYEALGKLKAANAIDAELIWNGGLIDKSKITLDSTGAISGLDEQIEALKTSRAQLFPQVETVPAGTGKDGIEDVTKGVATRADFLKLTAEQQFAFKEANPTLFRQFLTADN